MMSKQDKINKFDDIETYGNSLSSKTDHKKILPATNSRMKKIKNKKLESADSMSECFKNEEFEIENLKEDFKTSELENANCEKKKIEIKEFESKKNVIEIIETTKEHVEYLANNLRKLDEKELFYMRGKNAKEELRISVEYSIWTKSVLYNDECIAIFGFAKHNANDSKGVPWLLASDKLQKLSIRIARLCPFYINKMLEDAQYLENYILSEHTHSIKWLKWLGFSFDEPQEFGIFNKQYRRFYLCAPQYCQLFQEL